MRLSRRQLNRTLLHRQHLLERVALTPGSLVTSLVGLPAQDPLSPYLSLHARLTDFDPVNVSRGLENAGLVRLGTLRGALHLHEAADALALRPWLQPALDRQMEARIPVEHEVLAEAVAEALADGPVEHRTLMEMLAARFPASGSELVVVARTILPLVQLPPRGTWRSEGGITHEHLERWTGGALAEVDAEQVVRRYLRAFGPAAAGDLSVWSGVTRLRPLLTRMPDLVRHEDEDGKMLFDVPEGVIADEDVPAPVRLLGSYDNLWLAHAARDRVTEVGTRGAWMGGTGAVTMTVFVDGWLTGTWQVDDHRVRIGTLFRELSPTEQDELDEEIALVDELLAPARGAG